MWLRLLLDPAAQLVGGLDVARSQQLQRWVKLLVWAWALSAHILTAGAGIALFGVTESAQDTGVAMLYGGVAAAGAALGIAFLRMDKLLQGVLGGLDALSNSAKQVVALRKVLRPVGLLVSTVAPQMILVMCVGRLRALAGVLVWYAVGMTSLASSASVPYHEHNRLRPARSRSIRALKLTPRSSKVQPGADAAAAARELAIDRPAQISPRSPEICRRDGSPGP